MTVATFRNASGRGWIVSNKAKNAAGTEFTLLNTMKNAAGASFLIFKDTIFTTPPAGLEFEATDDREFWA